MSATPTEPAVTRDHDVIVIGAGFAGLRALHTLRGRGFDVAVLEAADGIGGVWQANRYPGARCDVESYDYSYGFDPELEQEWRWSERFATQPEILSYVEHVADRFGLRDDIHLGRRVTDMRWSDADGRWTLTTAAGETWSARWVVLAVGQLSVPKLPELPGQECFRGSIFHSADWPREPVDLSGKRVGVIGTGSTGIQMVPVLAGAAGHLTVFQRTPNFSVPACNAPLDDATDSAVKAAYRERRAFLRASPTGLSFEPYEHGALEVSAEQRRERYEQAWNGSGFGFLLAFPDLLLSEAANETAADFVREKISAVVTDPETREKLLPRGYPFGAKRPCVDSGYFETFNRANVELVDILSDPIIELTEDGVRTESGVHPLDVLVFATGFDAITGALLRPEIHGRMETLRAHWAAGPSTHLGLGVSGFPNLFPVAGPGSPSLLSNVMLAIEEHIDWITDLLTHAREAGTEVIEARAEAEGEWTAHVAERAAMTLYPNAKSYYMGDEIPGKPRVFGLYVGGVRRYRRALQREAEGGYAGFTMTSAPDSPATAVPSPMPAAPAR